MNPLRRVEFWRRCGAAVFLSGWLMGCAVLDQRPDCVLNRCLDCISNMDEAVEILSGDGGDRGDGGNGTIVLAVPHDGTDSLCGVGPRHTETDEPFFTNDRDVGVSALARQIRAVAAARRHTIPTMIVNRIARSQLDANRSREKATDNPRADQAWLRYHEAIAHVLADGQGRSGRRIILLDLHSQATYPADILTLSGEARSPEEGPPVGAFLQSLHASGYGVYGVSKTVHAGFADAACLFPCELPLNDAVPDHYLDGFTARLHRRPGVIALQIEVHARNLWSTGRMERLAEALEEALDAMLRG